MQNTKVALTEIEILQVSNARLKERIGELQLQLIREEKSKLYEELIRKYGIQGVAVLSDDGTHLSVQPALKELKKASLEKTNQDV